MDNNMYKTIPLEMAMEYYVDAAKKARQGAIAEERQRIITLLKKNGYHEAAFKVSQEIKTTQVG